MQTLLELFLVGKVCLVGNSGHNYVQCLKLFGTE